MPDLTSSRLVQTTSMTTAECKMAKQITKKLANGETPTEEMVISGPPRRAGLRGLRYAYKDDEPPKRIERHPPKELSSDILPVARLEGQEDQDETALQASTIPDYGEDYVLSRPDRRVMMKMRESRS
ncbi:hypothetical protein FRC06_002082 [Ceratobasidium sp. 370]|nr:hypothetical protein FRC06_002082 [Ceratobasidium sp. 370]